MSTALSRLVCRVAECSSAPNLVYRHINSWYEKILQGVFNENNLVKSIEVLTTFPFGEASKANNGFVMYKVILEDPNIPPTVVFARGDSVAILITVDIDSVEHAILTYQTRIPIGTKYLELPAGMVDYEDESSFVTACKELNEEVGIPQTITGITKLTTEHQMIGPMKNIPVASKMIPSAGGSDETIDIFYKKIDFEIDIKNDIITNKDDWIYNLKNNLFGNKHEGEEISLILVPINDIPKYTRDAKALSALSLYRMNYN